MRRTHRAATTRRKLRTINILHSADWREKERVTLREQRMERLGKDFSSSSSFCFIFI